MVARWIPVPKVAGSIPVASKRERGRGTEKKGNRKYPITKGHERKRIRNLNDQFFGKKRRARNGRGPIPW